jgi:hypothetical protein
LENVQREHAKVQRRLMKSTQIDAVAPEEREEFLLEMDERKKHLVRLGYGHALAEMEKDMVTISTEFKAENSAESVLEKPKSLMPQEICKQQNELIVESKVQKKHGNYHLAHKGGEDDEAYYSAGFDIDDETHETIARDCSASAAHEIIFADAKARGFDTYEVNNNGIIRNINKEGINHTSQKAVGDVSAKVLEFDHTKPECYAQVMADAALQVKYQDVLDAFFQERLLDVRKVLSGQGWNQMVDSSDMQKDGFELVSDFKWIGAGRNVIGVTYDFMDVKTGMVSDGEFIVDDLTKTPEQLAAHIDEKLHATQEKSVNFTPEIESTADKLKMAIANRVEIVVNLNNGQYRGVVSDVLEQHVVQNIGRGFVVVHDRALMNDDVVKDVKMDIRYRNGKPVIKIVESQSQEIVR